MTSVADGFLTAGRAARGDGRLGTEPRVDLLVPLYFPTCWFSDLKKRRKDISWLKSL